MSSNCSRSRSRSRSRPTFDSTDRFKHLQPPTPVRHALGKRRSETITQRTLNEQQRDESLARPNHLQSRPWTTGMQGSERVDDDFESSNLEDKIFHAVKDVLSRAVFEKGRIDQDNVDIVIEDVKMRLKSAAPPDEDQTPRQEDNNNEVKPKSNPSTKGTPLRGVIRRRINPPVKQTNDYLRVYPSNELSKPEETRYRNEKETMEYINLPDTDESQFNAHVKKEVNGKRIEENKNSSFLEKYITKSDVQTKNTVMQTNKIGDCEAGQKYSSFSFWKAAEEATVEEKLHRYLEALVRKQVNDEIHGKVTCDENEEPVRNDDSVCRSRCVCKVCVANKNAQRFSDMKRTNQEDQHLDGQRNGSGVKRCPASQGKIFRQYKTVPKGPTSHSAERNSGVSKSSRTSIASSRHKLHNSCNETAEVKPKGSYVVVSSNDDPNDDMFLKRRLGKRVALHYGS